MVPRIASIVLVLAAACGSQAAPSKAAVIVVNVPEAQGGVVGNQIISGARLAVEEINAAGGVDLGGSSVRLTLRVMDSELSPSKSAANVREAVRIGAVAVVDEGTGVDASWQIAASANMPVGIVYQGGRGLIDPVSRPNVFRVAPTDRGVAFRLAEYLVPKGVKLAIVRDDSPYGNGGASSLDAAFARNPESVTKTIRVAAASSDVSPAILDARRSGATGLLVWARPLVVAAAARAARSRGWNVPIYAGITGEDPLVRQQLSGNPEWLEGLTFAASRLTSEQGPKPFERFRAAYEKRFGPNLVGVRSRGREVVQPPDWAMYPYDFVRIVAKAMSRAKTDVPGPSLITAMNDVEVQGANGDERGFNERNHEGIVDDDVFFAVIRDMVFVPAQDDALSATLPAVHQTL